MEFTTAISLIKDGVPELASPQRWADLGCGRGLFTRALASRLAAGSSILCVDSDKEVLNAIPVVPGIEISKQAIDFRTLFPSTERFHGILMANALHFVREKEALLTALRSSLGDGGRFIVIEYDIETPSVWVPFPVSFSTLEILAQKCGFVQISLLHSISSRYNLQTMYSALLS